MTLHNLDVAIALAVVMLGVSLLITILTQAIATGLATRGRTLRDGLTVLFKTVCPEGVEHAKAIADEVLTHELISDSTVSTVFNKTRILKNYRLATAVRVDELLAILNKLTSEPAAQENPPPRNANSETGPTKDQVMRELVRGAKMLTPRIEAVTQRTAAVVEKVEEAAGALVGHPETGQQQSGQGPAGAHVATSLTVDRVVQNIPAIAEIFLKPDSIKAWFNSAMDRASQKFILKMRLITIVCSVIVAFGLHLDTFRFLSQVSADPELRAGLVSASQAMQTQAAAVLNRSPNPAAPGAPQEPPVNVPQAYEDALQKTVSDFKASLTSAAARMPTHLDNREAGEQWLRKEMNDDPKTQQAVTQYELAVENGLRSNTDRLLDNAASIKGSLDYAGFRLIPDPYHGWDFWPVTNRWWRWDNLHFWGILFSAGLLSLGAPFWFNALKTLSSLRPVVASKEEKEQQTN